MIDITKNFQDVKIHGFAIANFNHTKNFHFLYIILWAVHTTNTLLSPSKKIHKLVTSLTLSTILKGNNIILCIFHYYFKENKKHDSHHLFDL